MYAPIKTKRRNTIDKVVAQLLRDGKEREALEVCMYGRELSYEEFSFRRLYFESEAVREAIVSGNKTKGVKSTSTRQLKIMHQSLKRREKMICDMFLEAVRNHDRKAIIRIADAVEFWKDKRGDKLVISDRERTLIMIYNTLFGSKKTTMRSLVFFLKHNGIKIENTADGHAALRRKCKQMGFEFLDPRRLTPKQLLESL